MHEQLTEVITSLESAQSRIRQLTDSVSEKAWNRKPAPERWSAAECVEHLNLTSRAYIPLLRDALAEARLSRAPAPKRYSRDALGWFLAMMIGPLRHVGKLRLGKVKTTEEFVPHPKGGRTKILSEFVRLQSELISLTRAADGLAIDKVKIVSPFGGKMKYNAYSALVIIPRHEHRHIEQAEEAVG
ncbi:MAG TPA: DinB family protein [Gemmatimonadaceae bacterium]|nr:DinB family protein [Gemmatimonadaceae bacterium]